MWWFCILQSSRCARRGRLAWALCSALARPSVGRTQSSHVEGNRPPSVVAPQSSSKLDGESSVLSLSTRLSEHQTLATCRYNASQPASQPASQRALFTCLLSLSLFWFCFGQAWPRAQRCVREFTGPEGRGAPRHSPRPIPTPPTMPSSVRSDNQKSPGLAPKPKPKPKDALRCFSVERAEAPYPRTGPGPRGRGARAPARAARPRDEGTSAFTRHAPCLDAHTACSVLSRRTG